MTQIQTNEKLNKINYLIGGALGIVSFPLAGLYLSRKKEITQKAASVLLGSILSIGLSASIITFRGIDISEPIHSSENVSIEKRVSYYPLNDEGVSFLDTTLFFATNKFMYMSVTSYPKYQRLLILINGKDGKDTFECKYDSIGNNFKNDLKDIDKISVVLNQKKINGEQGKMFYGGLCEKVFKKEVQKIAL